MTEHEFRTRMSAMALDCAKRSAASRHAFSWIAAKSLMLSILSSVIAAGAWLTDQWLLCSLCFSGGVGLLVHGVLTERHGRAWQRRWLEVRQETLDDTQRAIDHVRERGWL